MRARRLYLLSEEVFATAMTQTEAGEVDLARLVQDFYRTVLATDDHVRIAAAAPVSEQLRKERVAHYSEVLDRTQKDLATNNFGSASFITATLLKKHGMTQALGERGVRQVQQAMLRAGCDLAEAMKARWEGNFNFEPKDKLLKVELDQAMPPVPPERATSNVAPQTGDVFSVRAEGFREAQVRRKVWEKQTALQARKTYSLWHEVSGDRLLAGYVRTDAVRFKNLLQDLPADYGKAAKYRGMSAEDIVAANATSGVERISSRTVQRHLAALSALWQDAIEKGEAGENIFGGFKFAKQRRPEDQRAMWTPDDLARLFDTPIWRGCQSAARRSKPGKVVIRDEKFWLPLIAIFSALRQEEICQLHCADVRQEEGIWVFDINSEPPRQLKNTNAVRLVPVHEKLIKLGLLDYVEVQRRAGRDRLFEKLNGGGADNRFGHNFTKWFTRYRRDVGLYRQRLDFHSFRLSATTFMQWTEVPLPVIDRLTGHASVGETARYTKHLQISQLADGIHGINPNVDLSYLEHRKGK
jgi:integrase